MEDRNICEYVVSPAKQLKWRLIRALAVLGYVVYGIAFFVVGVMTKFLIPAIALIPLTTWMLVFFTWRYATVEYEYTISSGTMTLSKIYGGRSRRTLAEIRIKEMHLIAPFDGEYIKQAEHYMPERTLDLTSTLQSPDVYFALYETEQGRRGILYFEATAHALKLLRYYNPSTVVSTVRY